MRTSIIATALLSVFVLGASCTKWVEPDCSGRLLAEETAPETGGSFVLPLSYDKAWKAEPVESWLSVNLPGYVEGLNALTVKCASNESSAGRRNFNRTGRILVRTYDRTVCDTIAVRQKGLTAEFSLESVEVAGPAGSCSIPLVSNLTDEERCRVSFSTDRVWAGPVEIDLRNTSLLVGISGAPAADSATVTMKYTPVWGEPVSAQCRITVR